MERLTVKTPTGAALKLNAPHTEQDTKNKRNKQIDLDKPHKGMKPHTHHGYFHNENDSPKGVANLTTEERRMVDLVKEKWYNKNNK